MRTIKLKAILQSQMTGVFLITIYILLFAGSCSTTHTGIISKGKISEKVAHAASLYEAGKYADAIIECSELARIDPLMPGLAELQQKIMKELTTSKAEASTLRSTSDITRMSVDVDVRKEIPLTYGLRRPSAGETSPLRTTPSSMEQILAKRVTVSLDNVGLSQFIQQIGRSENINIIADNIQDTGTLTLHVKDVPLAEILDYVSRNLGVAFYAGENIIWVTPGDTSISAIPMETRMYRLRKGLAGSELDSSGKLSIIEAITKFVPSPPGADLLFDRKSHVLIARNTRENLAKIEDIIQTLDVCPPQVLIEARFISTSITDLSELGIDWILNSPYTITRKRVLRDGAVVRDTHTRIDATAPKEVIGFAPFANTAEGLNMSYQGVLTDPMFQAVLHALETSGKSRTLSVPKITTINNSLASIRIGEDFRFYEEYDVQSVPSSVTTGGAQVYSSMLVPVGTPKLEELGIQLSVTPSVGADLKSITLKLVPEISEFVRYEVFEVGTGSTTVSGPVAGVTNTTSLIKLPIFRRSKIETEVVVHSGETIVMGGLITSTEDKNERKVPILSSIPLVGKLFRHDVIEERKQNLLIFVTASILSERGEEMIPIGQETSTSSSTPQANGK